MQTETVTAKEAIEIIDGIDFKTADSQIDGNRIVLEQRNKISNRDVKITFERIEEEKSLVVSDSIVLISIIDWTIDEGYDVYRVELDQPFNLALPAEPFKQEK